MTNIIDLAKKAGFFFIDAGHGPEILHTLPKEYSSRCFERFAQYVIEQHELGNAFDSAVETVGAETVVKGISSYFSKET